jgi:X-Pro dipeptidyl-peptidase
MNLKRKLLILLVILLSGSLKLSAQTRPPATQSSTTRMSATQPVAPALPVFVDGQAQIVPGFNNPQNWIRQDLWVETSFDTDGDGKPDRVHVDVTRPPQTELFGLKLPVIYESSPYFGGTDSEQTDWNIQQEVDTAPQPRPHGGEIHFKGRRPIISNSLTRTWVPRGFIVVHSEAPGTGLSQGVPTVGGDSECLAPKAVIDWLNGRAKGFTTATGNEQVSAYWTTGKVGMTGTSYNGTIAVAAATTGVDGLEAIIPIAPNTSYYHYYRSNGLVRSPGGYPGEDIDCLFDYINSGNLDDPIKRKFALTVERDGEMAKGMDRTTGDYNDFWASRDLLPRVGNMKAALLMSHGFNDWNVVPEHSFRIWQAVKNKVPSQVYYHQAGHGGGPPLAMQNKWFTRYLFGVQNKVEDDPRAWIVRENDPAEKPTPYKDYPNPDASPVTLHLSADGLKVGSLGITAVPGQGKETLIDDASFTGAQLATTESNHRLLFATPTLAAPVHLSGLTTITIKLACNKPAANLSVWMVELPWTPGRAVKLTENLLTRGWADPQNYRSLTKGMTDYHSMTTGEPLISGTFYEMTFPLEPQDRIIPAGRKIGLMILSSDHEFTLWPKPGTELTVDLDSTSIEIPVVGGVKAFEQALKH